MLYYSLITYNSLIFSAKLQNEITSAGAGHTTIIASWDILGIAANLKLYSRRRRLRVCSSELLLESGDRLVLWRSRLSHAIVISEVIQRYLVPQKVYIYNLLPLLIYLRFNCILFVNTSMWFRACLITRLCERNENWLFRLLALRCGGKPGKRIDVVILIVYFGRVNHLLGSVGRSDKQI